MQSKKHQWSGSAINCRDVFTAFVCHAPPTLFHTFDKSVFFPSYFPLFPPACSFHISFPTSFHFIFLFFFFFFFLIKTTLPHLDSPLGHEHPLRSDIYALTSREKYRTTRILRERLATPNRDHGPNVCVCMCVCMQCIVHMHLYKVLRIT